MKVKRQEEKEGRDVPKDLEFDREAGSNVEAWV